MPLMLMRETRSSRGDFITYRALVDADIIVRNDGKEGSGKIDSSYASMLSRFDKNMEAFVCEASGKFSGVPVSILKR